MLKRWMVLMAMFLVGLTAKTLVFRDGVPFAPVLIVTLVLVGALGLILIFDEDEMEEMDDDGNWKEK